MNQRIQLKIGRFKKIYTVFLVLIAGGALVCVILGVLAIIDIGIAILITLGLVIMYLLTLTIAGWHLNKLRYS